MSREDLQRIARPKGARPYITFQRDEAKQDVYFNNTIASPENDYTYDALYRLIQAGGREHVGNSVTTSSPDADRWSDASRIQLAHTHDETKMRPYIQYYEYDQVGNMLIQQHTTTSSTYNWTKEFVIDDASNKLFTEKHVYAEDYSYDNRGNLISGMAHLGDLSYNEANRMEVSPNATSSIITYYQYDSGGQRVRKVKADSSSGITHTRKYVGQWEVYARDQSGLQLERETLHIADDTGRIAIVDTPVVDNLGTGETQLLRYQYANHLGTATLELDDSGYVISYEEYYPFGTTSFQSGRTTAEVSLKRYRFTGKERDEETGMYYHGARYYIPWLCRWAASDPINNEWYNAEKGISDRNLNRDWIELTASSYEYCYDNPVRFTDPTGEQPPSFKNLPAPSISIPAPAAASTGSAPIVMPPQNSELPNPGKDMEIQPLKQAVIKQSRAQTPYERSESSRLANQARMQKELAVREQLDPVGFGLGTSPGVQAGLALALPEVGLLQGGAQMYGGLERGNKTDVVLGAISIGLGSYSVLKGGSFSSFSPMFAKQIASSERISENMVMTPYSIARQSSSEAAIAARSQVQSGSPLYRIGTLNQSAAAEGQFWSLENPLTDPIAYAKKYGMPLENIVNADFIEIGVLKSNINFITREAPISPNNPLGWGGGIEVVVPQNSVTIQSFHTFR